MPFWLELEEVEDCSLVVLEMVEPDVDEVEETAVLEEDVDEELMEEVVVLSVKVTVELIVDDDEAVEDPKEDVREVIETDEGMEPELDEGLETDDVELGACSVIAAPSVTSVSTTATATIA